MSTRARSHEQVDSRAKRERVVDPSRCGLSYERAQLTLSPRAFQSEEARLEAKNFSSLLAVAVHASAPIPREAAEAALASSRRGKFLRSIGELLFADNSSQFYRNCEFAGNSPCALTLSFLALAFASFIFVIHHQPGKIFIILHQGVRASVRAFCALGLVIRSVRRAWSKGLLSNCNPFLR